MRYAFVALVLARKPHTAAITRLNINFLVEQGKLSLEKGAQGK